MTGAFAWLDELMRWLGRWFPRLVLVRRSHVGVWFGPGGRTRTYRPGLHVYWPLTSDLVVVSLRARSMEIACQLQGREVVSLAVFFSLLDPERVLLTQNDVFSMLDDRAQAALARAYAPDAANGAIEAAVLKEMRGAFSADGVTVAEVHVLQRGRAIPLKNMSDWAQHAKAEL